jgi:bacteriorhodopsin
MRRWIWFAFAVAGLLALTAWRAMTFDSSSQPVTIGR